MEKNPVVQEDLSVSERETPSYGSSSLRAPTSTCTCTWPQRRLDMVTGN